MNEYENENPNNQYENNINDMNTPKGDGNENNYVEKPLHGSNFPNSIMGSALPMNNEIQIPNQNFTYFQSTDKIHTFKFDDDIDHLNNIYNDFKDKCPVKYVFCILIKNDTNTNNYLLKKTLEGIEKNINGLSNFLIHPENILICVFFNEILNQDIFKDEDISLIKDDYTYIISEKNYSVNDQIVPVHCIAKRGYMPEIESLRVFYSIIINQIKTDNNIIFSSVLTAGVCPYEHSLESLIKLSYNSSNAHAIIVPQLEDVTNGKETLIYKVKKYERIHFNLYNMNFYDKTISVPVSSLFNIMTLDNKLTPILVNFYKDIKLEQSLDYHDYRLSIYLSNAAYKIIYYNSFPRGSILYLPDEPLADYKDSWVRRYSGYYGNIFEIFQNFIDCGKCDAEKKIFLLFHIIGLLIEFIFPSLSAMVIYSIFHEAFDILDNRPAAFFTLLYVFVFVCSGACSLISKDSRKMPMINLFFYFFMEVYYIFILICSIAAMDHINKNKKGHDYKFNTSAMVCIILFTLIPALLPMLMRMKTITDNFVPMLLYLLLGAPASNSTLHISKILSAGETVGGINTKERQGIIILAYVLINLFFGSLTFYNYDRKRRVETVMGFGIFYLIYNLFKTIAIILGLSNSDKNLYINNSLIEEIKRKLEHDNMNNSYYQNKDGYDNNQYDYNQNEYNQNEYNQKASYNPNEPNNNNQDFPTKSQIDANNNYGGDNYI